MEDQPFFVEFDKRHRFRGLSFDGYLPALEERMPIKEEDEIIPEEIREIRHIVENSRAISMSSRKMVQTFLKDRKSINYKYK